MNGKRFRDHFSVGQIHSTVQFSGIELQFLRVSKANLSPPEEQWYTGQQSRERDDELLQTWEEGLSVDLSDHMVMEGSPCS